MTERRHLSKKYSAFREGWLLSEKVRNWTLGCTFFPALILGTWGYVLYQPLGETITFGNALYHTAQLFVLHTPHFTDPVPWQLGIAKWLAAASTILILINMGLFLVYHERMQMLLNKRKDHMIICGLGRSGMAFVEFFYSKKTPVVAIDNHPDPDVEERLFNMNIPLIVGDATRKEILLEARIEYAQSLYTLCPDDITNCTIAMEGYNIGCLTPRKCFIHINEAELRNALQINHPIDETDKKQTLSFMDAYGPEAISLLTNELPLDHDGIKPDDTRQVHLIILGFGQMGRTVAVKAAQLGQFANFKPLRISVIDRKAEINENELIFHHRFIKEVADFKFYQQEILSPATWELMLKWCDEPDVLVNVAVCFDDQPVALDTVFHLLPVFNKSNIRVAVRVKESKNLEFLLKGFESKKYKELRIIPFGTEKSIERLIDPDLDNTEKFARDIHNAYVEMIKRLNEGKPEELEKILRSEEMQEWNILREDFRESNRQQSLHMNFKIRAAGFEIADTNDSRPAIDKFGNKLFEVLAKMEHNRWVAERKVNNWEYGKISIKENRINKNLKKWEELEPDVQQYDFDTIGRIPILLESIGKKIVMKPSA